MTEQALEVVHEWAKARANVSAAECNHLVADDGDRQCWATIRSGLSAGLQEPIDLGN